MIQRVLGIETSCDETAVAIYDGQQGLIAHHIHSQIATHQKWGGVVPELASRDHIKKLSPLILQSCDDAKLTLQDINGIAYTCGPGLVGALMTGAAVARSLGYALNIPTIGLHHMESHLLAAMLETPQPSFPFVALLVSGGHTLLVKVTAYGNYHLLGESLDDAVGEAFDKTAKLLGLPYPGGPALAKLASSGNNQRFHLTRPMVNRPGCDFSFSGLKTQVAKLYDQQPHDPQTLADIACAFEDAAVDTLIIKAKRALKQTNLHRLVMVGGVSANSKLRRRIKEEVDGEVFYPRREFCTDNGAMVAYNGWLRLNEGQYDNLHIVAKPRWPLTAIT